MTRVGVGDKVASPIARTRIAFANLRHLWHWHSIRISVSERMYGITACSVLPYCCNALLLRFDDAQWHCVFEYRYVQNIDRFWWEHGVDSDRARHRMLGVGSRPPNQVNRFAAPSVASIRFAYYCQSFPSSCFFAC